MPHRKVCSKKLLLNILNIVLLSKIVNARTIVDIPLHTSDTQVSEKFNNSENTPIKEFLQGDASAIVQQILKNPVKKPGGSYRTTSKPEKFNNESYGSKIILGIVENIKDNTTPKPVDDQAKSQTIVKYFDQEDYNGLHRNPIVVADIFDDKENNQQKRIRNRKEILDLDQEESPIKPDLDTKEKSEQIHNVGEKEQKQNLNEGGEREIASEEIDSIEELDKHKSFKWNKENDNGNEGIEENEENVSSKEDVENGSAKEEESIERNEEDTINKQDVDNQSVKADAENENIKEDDEYKEGPIYKDNEEYKENPEIENIEQSSNTEDGQSRENGKYKNEDKSEESLTDVDKGDENEKQKDVDYWNPYRLQETNAENKKTSNLDKDNTHTEQDSLPKYEENEDTHSKQLSEKDTDQKSNIDVLGKDSISEKESTNSNQDKSADHTHADVKKKKKRGKHSSGKGKEHHSHVYGKKGEKGLKAYKGHHEESKASKGHHDKEHHGKKYSDEKGESKKHHEERGHHGQHHKGEKGEKASDFSEEGKHSKGHSTSGEHNIHKNDEYNKKEVFYDEHHEGGEHEKHGGFEFDDHFEKGGYKKGGHHKKGDHKDHFGKKSHHAKGKNYHEEKGHKKAGGHDEHHNHHSKYGKKKGDSGKKHWAYEKGTGGGHGKKKKYSTDPQDADTTPQHIERTSSHSNNEEEKNNPKYISHQIDDKRDIHDEDEDTPRNEKTEVSQEEHAEKEEIVLDDDEGESSEIKIKKEKIPFNSNYKYVRQKTEEKYINPKKKYNWDTIEKFDTEDEVSSKEKNKELTNATEKQKIYVIIPENLEEEKQPSEGYLEIEPFPSKNGSKFSKVSEPSPEESIPEEHIKKVTEIKYVVHSNENVKNKRMSPIYNNIREFGFSKPRQFSVSRS